MFFNNQPSQSDCNRQLSRTAKLATSGLFALTTIGAHAIEVNVPGNFDSPCKAVLAANELARNEPNPAKHITVINVAYNTYRDDVCAVRTNNLTINGISNSAGQRPHIKSEGKNSGGKGIFEVYSDNFTVRNLEVSGVSVPDLNGAAFRLAGNNFTLLDSYIHDNDNGILEDGKPESTITVKNTEFAFNGFGEGKSHNVYIGTAKSLVFMYNYSHDAKNGHNLKSRAQNNTVHYNRFSSDRNAPSYEAEFPNAGNVSVVGNIFQQPAANNNPALVAYGLEAITGPTQSLKIVNNTFINSAGNGRFIWIADQVQNRALIQNNAFTGPGTLVDSKIAHDLRNNLVVSASAFVNLGAFNLVPATGSPLINAGSIGGLEGTLLPAEQYKHSARSESRSIAGGGIDIGAYELAGGTPPVVNPPVVNPPVVNPPVVTPPVVTPPVVNPPVINPPVVNPPVVSPPTTDQQQPTVTVSARAVGTDMIQFSIKSTDNIGVKKLTIKLDDKTLMITTRANMDGTISTRGMPRATRSLSATAVDAANNSRTASWSGVTGG